MSGEEEENPPETRGVHPKPVNPNRVSIYVRPVDREWVRAAREALERDKSSLSAFFLERLRKWWERKKPGNPQTPLARFAETPAPMPGIGLEKKHPYCPPCGSRHPLNMDCATAKYVLTKGQAWWKP